MDKNFPVGLRVLVVDDDTFYLNSIESQLKSCQYHVTATNKVRKALGMLEENKNDFQIMIINAEMVDLDVIKLLQFLNLEVNLPIVLLSTSNDTKQVMEWMQAGAYDCLVKPVEIDELRQLWKHVFRWNNYSMHHGSGDRLAGGSKGKEIIECSGEDNNNIEELEDNDDLAIDMPIQKNPRFAWSIELHQKFVDVVNQLGLNKAFPKKIVELMNVEGLTREKVASHLQKYKLYLKKLNSGLIHQGFRFDAFGPDGVHISSLGGGHGVYRSLPGTGMVAHMNTNADLSHPRHLSSFPMLQTPQPPNLFNNSSRFLSPNLLENQTNNLFPNSPNPSLFSPLATSLMPYENPPLLNLKEYQNQSSPLFSPSSTLGTSGMRSASIFPNCGPSQPQSSLHNNLLSPNDAHNPLDSFCGISSLSGNALNSDGLSGLNENFNSIGKQHIWPNQSQDYVLNPYNISTTTNSNTTPTISPTVVGASPFTYFEGVSSDTGGQNPNNEIDHNIDEYVGSSENLEELIGRILK